MGKNKKLALGGSIFLVFLLVLVGGYFGVRLRPGKETAISNRAISGSPTAVVTPPAPTETPPPVTPPAKPDRDSAEAKNWAQMMLSSYPYDKNTFAGVQPAKRADEVWVVGFLTGAGGIYPANQQYLGVKNNFGQFQGKLSDEALFTIQTGDRLTAAAETAPPATIKDGQLVAARMTFANNFALILEVRRLLNH